MKNKMVTQEEAKIYHIAISDIFINRSLKKETIPRLVNTEWGQG